MSTTHEELTAVRESVRSILGEAETGRDIWGSLADSGFAGVAVEGIDDVPLAPLLTGIAEEIGARVSPVPFLSHAAIAGGVLSRMPGDAADRHTTGATAILALPLTHSAWDAMPPHFAAHESAGGWAVHGSVANVLNATDAAHLLVPAVSDGRILLLSVDRQDPGCHVEGFDGADPSRPIGEVRLDGASGVLVGEGTVVVEALRYGLALGTACLSAESIGAASRFLDQTIAYLKERWAFGRPIGSFQAVKHTVVDLFVELAQARALLRDATEVLGADPAVSRETLARLTLAKLQSAKALHQISHRGILLHGAIGFTWELGAHRFVRRSLSDRLLLGDPDALTQEVADEIGERQAEAPDSGPADSAEAWLRAQAPQFVGARDHVGHFAVLSREEVTEQAQRARRWEKAKFDAGYAGIAVEKRYGGQGKSQYEALRFQTLEHRYDLPHWIFAITHGMILPTVATWGSDEQKNRHIRPMLDGSELWCQLFSEPGAGSDLAMAATRAVRVDGGWRVSGQKVWNSGADLADFGLLVARTDPDQPKHKGLTVFVVPMDAAGVTVRPIIQASGSALFCEVFFEDVFLPDTAVVGEVGNGWRVALTTLMNERVALTGDGVPFHRALELGRSRAEMLSPAAKIQLAGVVSLHRALASMSEQLLEGLRTGAEPGPEGSVNKLLTGRAAMAVAEFAVTALGTELLNDRDWHEYVVGNLGLLIGGGTEEIQKNIIAERVLGLPQEPKPRARLSWAEEKSQIGAEASNAR